MWLQPSARMGIMTVGASRMSWNYPENGDMISLFPQVKVRMRISFSKSGTGTAENFIIQKTRFLSRLTQRLTCLPEICSPAVSRKRFLRILRLASAVFRKMKIFLYQTGVIFSMETEAAFLLWRFGQEELIPGGQLLSLTIQIISRIFLCRLTLPGKVGLRISVTELPYAHTRMQAEPPVMSVF